MIILIEVSGRSADMLEMVFSRRSSGRLLAVSAEMPIERVSGAGSANEDAAASDVAHAE